MIVPIGFDARTERRGYVTYALVAACALVFLCQMTPAGAEAARPYLAYHGVARWRAEAGELLRREVRANPSLRSLPQAEVEAQIDAYIEENLPPEAWDWTRRPWTLLTCAFLHADLWHVLGNLLFLFVFGRAVNGRMGHGAFLAVYLAAAVVASLAHVLLGAGSHGALLGASGAISGVMGLALAFFPRHNVRMFVWIFRFARVVDVRAFWAILYWFGYDLVMVFLVGDGNGVAVVAHVAGYVAGFAAGLALLASGLVRPDGWDLLSSLRRLRPGAPAA